MEEKGGGSEGADEGGEGEEGVGRIGGVMAGERFVYVDTETTDVKPGQIAQLAYIIADAGGNVEEARNLYFSVGLMSPGAEAIHHLSPAVLKALSEGRHFGDCIEEMLDAWYSNATFVAHNVTFDLKFVRAELSRYEFPLYSPKTFCTMQAMTPLCKLPGMYGKYKWPRVEEALRHAGIFQERVLAAASTLFITDPEKEPGTPPLGFHDARFDVTAVYLLHRWLLER
jgi:DNA polymerase-3 subunit epsilon